MAGGLGNQWSGLAIRQAAQAATSPLARPGSTGRKTGHRANTCPAQRRLAGVDSTERAGTRTQDLRIKSPLLYLLSYALRRQRLDCIALAVAGNEGGCAAQRRYMMTAGRSKRRVRRSGSRWRRSRQRVAHTIAPASPPGGTPSRRGPRRSMRRRSAHGKPDSRYASGAACAGGRGGPGVAGGFAGRCRRTGIAPPKSESGRVCRWRWCGAAAGRRWRRRRRRGWGRNAA